MLQVSSLRELQQQAQKYNSQLQEYNTKLQQDVALSNGSLQKLQVHSALAWHKASMLQCCPVPCTEILRCTCCWWIVHSAYFGNAHDWTARTADSAALAYVLHVCKSMI